MRVQADEGERHIGVFRREVEDRVVRDGGLSAHDGRNPGASTRITRVLLLAERLFAEPPGPM